MYIELLSYFFPLFFSVDVECFFFFFLSSNGCMVFSYWISVSIYMHFILAINRAAINIFMCWVFSSFIFCIFFSLSQIPRSEMYWDKEMKVWISS